MIICEESQITCAWLHDGGVLDCLEVIGDTGELPFHLQYELLCRASGFGCVFRESQPCCLLEEVRRMRGVVSLEPLVDMD